MQKVLTAAQMREVDRLTTERYGIPSILLMENAAHAVARVITEKLGGSVEGKSILILCGPGNNGGDGAALARILRSQDAIVHAVLFGDRYDSQGDARTNFEAIMAIAEKGDWHFRVDEFDQAELSEGDLAVWAFFAQNCVVKYFECVVDAVFGTGFHGPIREPLSTVLKYFVRNVKNSYLTGEIVSVDLPSGLDSDDSSNTRWHVTANTTITFTSPKPANILPTASNFNGELIVVDIGSPKELIDEQSSQLYLAEKKDVEKWLEATGFSDDSYKNKRGHALIIAGSESYSGAVVLAGDAAMRSGVGLVTIVTTRSSMDSIAARALPEVMVRGVAETENGAISDEAFEEISDLLGKANAIAIGSGLSQSESTTKFVEKVIKNRTTPVVVDADALNLLSPFAVKSVDSLIPLILTPHEGEFMRLLGSDDKDLIKDRVAAVREFSQKHNVILVLKGERVLIGEPGGKVVVNPTGNSGLGKAGNGDTLTGILAGFVTQAVAMKIDIFETVVAAVYVAGMAGDVAEKKFGKRVMTASDVRECMVDVFEELSK